MNTYFIRHTADMDIDDETRSRLWSERKIAVHFPWDNSGNKDNDSSQLDPESYSGSARKAMRAMTTLAQAGGYVCGRYFPPYEDCLVGVVEPNSKIELIQGHWGKKYNAEGRPAILKALQLTRVKIVSPATCAVIMVGRPRQGTVMKWPNAHKTIENIVEGRSSPPDLSDLSDAQQEIMCSELMRLPVATKLGLPSLARLLLPVGRTMPDVDIAGLAPDGSKVFAQVTYSPLVSCQHKLERLATYKAAGIRHLVFFCDCDSPERRNDVFIFPIRTAFETFSSSPLGAEWLTYAV